MVKLAELYRARLSTLVANWLRIGYCQGNFNSDNCAAGGYTLDYGPFGFCEAFDPEFQPWTGGGKHFCFFNQPNAAQVNYRMFWNSLRPLVKDGSEELKEFDKILDDLPLAFQNEWEKVWADKLGLTAVNYNLLESLFPLMVESQVDYTMFFRELSHLPKDVSAIQMSFYAESSLETQDKWNAWLTDWHQQLVKEHGENLESVSEKMKSINPKYAWREWLIVPAYEKAAKGDYSLVKELQEVLSDPYSEQSSDIEEKYYRLKPKEFFRLGGVSHYSCSS